MRRRLFVTRLIASACRGAVYAAMLMAACRPQPPAAPLQPEVITFESKDGGILRASLYRPASPQPPGLILVPTRNSSREAWSMFAQTAQEAGYLCLAVDLRGQGESLPPRGQPSSQRDFSTEDWKRALYDIAAAREAILACGAHPDNLAIVGAGLGANLALQYAVADPAMQAVVMVSPGLDYQGIQTDKAIIALANRPVLLMASKGDSYAAGSCARLKALAPSFSELREYEGAAHGVDLLSGNSLAAEQILLWLKAIIGPRG